MKAFGGRGMWLSDLFLPCPGRRGTAHSMEGGKREDFIGISKGRGGSLKVPGVTFGAKAMLWVEEGSIGTAQVS